MKRDEKNNVAHTVVEWHWSFLCAYYSQSIGYKFIDRNAKRENNSGICALQSGQSGVWVLRQSVSLFGPDNSRRCHHSSTRPESESGIGKSNEFGLLFTEPCHWWYIVPTHHKYTWEHPARRFPRIPNSFPAANFWVILFCGDVFRCIPSYRWATLHRIHRLIYAFHRSLHRQHWRRPAAARRARFTCVGKVSK